MRIFRRRLSYTLCGLIMLTLSGCDKGTGAFNVFSLDDDKKLGDQTKQQIASDPANYPLLDRTTYATAYSNLDRIIGNILNSGQLIHKDDFQWETFIIHNDTVLNAFCAPAGKMYVYTGIIKYLDAENQLAGVMGHEMAHADRRHVTDELTAQYGLQVLLDVVAGKNQGTLTQVAAGLATLKFSRDKEAEADKYSVIYLYHTDYDARGVGDFFKKLIDQGQAGSTPQFLSDHPSPENRLQAINDEWQSLGGKVGQKDSAQYADFKKSLP